MPTQIAREIQVALRRLVRAPVFTAFAVTSLAVGLGLSTAFYSVMNAVLWPAAGLVRPHRLVVLYSGERPDSANAWARNARGDFEEFRAAQTSMLDVAAWGTFRAAVVDASIATVVPGLAVTGNTFGLLGFEMSTGRAIQPTDDTFAAPAVVVLAHAFWLKNFHGQPVLGRIVRVNGVPCEVIGVAAKGVRTIGMSTFANPMVWVPLAALQRFGGPPSPLLDVANHSARNLGVIGRLKERVDIAAARVETAAIGDRLDLSFPRGRYGRAWSLERADLAFAVTGVWMGWTLVGLVVLVLLVAWTNLANLTLARGVSRRHELAVRRALGATGWTLIREPLIESAVIALTGGAAALLIAQAILQYIASQIPTGLNFDVPTTLSPHVLAAALVCGGVTLLVFGLWPAIEATKPDCTFDFGRQCRRWRRTAMGHEEERHRRASGGVGDVPRGRLGLCPRPGFVGGESLRY